MNLCKLMVFTYSPFRRIVVQRIKEFLQATMYFLDYSFFY